MVIFFAVLIYFLIIALCVFLVMQLQKLSKAVRLHKEAIDNLDKELYKDLRQVQYNAMNLSKEANRYMKDKNSILSEIISTALLSFLPFKKLKSIIYLHKIGKKII